MSITDLIFMLGLASQPFTLKDNNIVFKDLDKGFVSMTQREDFVSVGCYRVNEQFPEFHHITSSSTIDDMIAAYGAVFSVISLN